MSKKREELFDLIGIPVMGDDAIDLLRKHLKSYETYELKRWFIHQVLSNPMWLVDIENKIGASLPKHKYIAKLCDSCGYPIIDRSHGKNKKRCVSCKNDINNAKKLAARTPKKNPSEKWNAKYDAEYPYYIHHEKWVRHVEGNFERPYDFSGWLEPEYDALIKSYDEDVFLETADS